MSEIQYLPEVLPPGLPQSIQAPDQRAVLVALKREIMASFNCHLVGKVVSFNATKQTASVQVQYLRVVYNQLQPIEGRLQYTPQLYPYPLLTDVPVFVLSGGGAVITLPVAAGDDCLLLFNDRDLDIWFQGGGVSVPNSARLHSLSDALAIVGFRNAASQIASYSTTDIELRNAGGKVAVAAQIGIANATTSLRIALDQLMTALMGFVDTHGDTPSPATLAAFAAVKALFDALLK